jgi:hypothetical protein
VTEKREVPGSTDEALRNHLVAMLKAGHAHVAFRKAVDEWPIETRGARPVGATHSAWELVEHLRIAQWDILGFSQSSKHVSPEFPDGYWPSSPVPPDEASWFGSIEQFVQDLQAMQKLVLDPATDLYRRIPHGDGQTILREALTLGSHNSYHIGQLMTLRKILKP